MNRPLTDQELQHRRKIPVRTETWKNPEGDRTAIVEVGPEETLTVTYELFADMLTRLGYSKTHTSLPTRRNINA